MQEQGNADATAVPANDEAVGQTRPDWMATATSAVNAIRSGDLDAIRRAQQEGPESPYRVAEVATALGVNKATIYRAVESGQLAGLRFGTTRKGTIRIPHGAFVDYVAECMAAAVTHPDTTARRRSIRVDISETAPARVVA